MTIGIVVTTIYHGEFLDEYYAYFKARNELDQIRFYIIGDLSTPIECEIRAERYRAEGLPWFYVGPEAQKDFLLPFPELAAEIPWKSDNRRNVGFLMAYRDRCDTIIAIDDDNYPRQDWPFLDGHREVGTQITAPTATGYNGWFNLCALMQVNCPSLNVPGTVYARGFPYARRDPRCGQINTTTQQGYVAINAGLWSGDPDVDAATRLVTRCEAEAAFQESVLLAPNTLMPINTQNTALIRDAIPAYYYVRMGHPVGGMKLDRFGDIFSGFFVQKCVQAMGHVVRIGSPVVEHRRSPHNLYKDLWHELAGMVIIDDMLPLLEKPLPAATTYNEAALTLSHWIWEWAKDRQGFLWDDSLQTYFLSMSKAIALWTSACQELDS